MFFCKEDYGKYTFTILDFRNASRLFADPTFNGDPMSTIVVDGDGDDWMPPEIKEPKSDGDDKPTTHTPRKKIKVSGVDVEISNERISF